MAPLVVFRELRGEYEKVGVLDLKPDGTDFRYAAEYLSSGDASPISHSLPLGAFREFGRTRFFEGLLPEEGMREAFERSVRGSRGGMDGLISRLGNESSGALVFGDGDGDLLEGRGYEPADPGMIREFAARPRAVALDLGMASRLSLAGAQAKIGLRRDGTSWLIPKGSAPSTHILKASDGTFPGLAVNEAFCLELAASLGIPAARSELMDVPGGEPVIAVERFDRVLGAGGEVRRLHQEDFLQAKGNLAPYLKYEPTDGGYASMCQRLIDRCSSNPFRDRIAFLRRILFDYLAGNLDNHLKNHSFVWAEDWREVSLAPVYDAACCTIYPQLDREMGVSLCDSRRIDDVTRGSVMLALGRSAVPQAMVEAEADELAAGFGPAIDRTLRRMMIRYKGFPGTAAAIQRFAEALREDSARRLRILGR